MALIRWNPMQNVLSLQQEMNRIFHEFAQGGNSEETSWGASTWVPPVDVYETDEGFVLKAELPGVQKDDLHIDVHDRTLTMRGDRKPETEISEDRYHRQERSYGSFQRVFTLPTPIDADKVQANVHDGVLELRLPKHETAKPKRIAIQS
jgi:HSP20 family protein